MKERQKSLDRALEEAVSRALRDNLAPLQRTADELHQAYADLVAACSSTRPSNALPAMLRAQTAASCSRRGPFGALKFRCCSAEASRLIRPRLKPRTWRRLLLRSHTRRRDRLRRRWQNQKKKTASEPAYEPPASTTHVAQEEAQVAEQSAQPKWWPTRRPSSNRRPSTWPACRPRFKICIAARIE